jgi:streptogramin lyase
MYFHIPPLPRPYTVEWVGVLAAPQAGPYGLGLRAVDWAQLYLDDQLLLETSGPDIYSQATPMLDRGLHDLRLRFKDTTGRSRLHLWWQPPGQDGAAAIPRQYLWPSRSSYIETALLEPVSLEAAAGSLPVEHPLALPSPSAGQIQVISTHFGETLLSQPRGIAVGPDGRVYVADTGNHRLLILDRDGSLISQVNGGEEPFDDLSDVAVDDSGQVYVLDAGRARLSLFDGKGQYLGEVPAQPDYLSRSRGLFVDNQNRLWLANTSSSRLVALDLAGNVVMQFPIAADGQAQPVDVAVMPDGSIYSTDIILDKLIRFGPDGQQRDSWPIPHSTSVDGAHLAVDASGGLYVTLPEEGQVMRLDPQDGAIKSWELRRQGDGQKMKPVGVAVDAEGQIWTVDSAGGNIAVVTAAE